MRTFIFIMLLLTMVQGCKKPEITNRREFHDLEDFAQEYVKATLQEHYGDVTNVAVWDKLGLNADLGKATVEQASSDTGKTRLSLALPKNHPTILPNTELVWASGNLTGSSSVWISEWDDLTHVATLRDPIAKLPDVGSEVIIGPGQQLVRGRKIYAEQCQHCHGVSGDGNGPTAEYLNPRPRDYRRGIFKFTRTHASERASRDDLRRVIQQGMPGTYMPSFKLLETHDVDAVVEYVLWLSMRGESEYQLVKYLMTDYSKEAVKERTQDGLKQKAAGETDYETHELIANEFYELANDPDELPAEFVDSVGIMANRWAGAQKPTALIVPKVKRLEMTPESIERGRKLYLSADLNCFACHGQSGNGDGPQQFSITKDLETGKDNPKPGLYDAWGNPNPPRNLRTGSYRGGRTPIDLFARMHSGIKGTSMPAFGTKLKEEDIWDLVNYVYSLNYSKPKLGEGVQEAIVIDVKPQDVASE